VVAYRPTVQHAEITVVRMNRVIRFVCFVWAAPATAVGLVGALGALTLGATARVVDGVVEVGGGRLAMWVGRLPTALRFEAITFGHVVLGATHTALSALRSHERVHVRQYERWGLLFFPLYLGSSLAQLLRGRDPYLHNCFERQAFAQAARSRSRHERLLVNRPRRPRALRR
jgi:hypothetical protein